SQMPSRSAAWRHVICRASAFFMISCLVIAFASLAMRRSISRMRDLAPHRSLRRTFQSAYEAGHLSLLFTLLLFLLTRFKQISLSRRGRAQILCIALYAKRGAAREFA